jgi:oligopeptide transport system ATP-binding protein
MSSLNPLITVGKQVEEMILTHENRSGNDVKERVLALFNKVRIPDPRKRYRSYPHEFSGGMRQRVMIAMALACRPSLLIADEPTTALDVTIQDQILKLLKSLQDDLGMSVAFISHDLGVIAEVCSRIVVLYAGMVMEEAPIEEVFTRPAHPYTLGLLESIPGVDQDRSARLQPILGSPPDMSKPPAGCPFHPRCPYARNICSHRNPPFVRLAPGHGSRCWLQTDEAPSEGNPFTPREDARV